MSSQRLKAAWHQIRRTPYQALAAVMVLTFTFLATMVFSLVSLGAVKILRHFESAPQVIAFFEVGVDLPQQKIESIKNQLEQTGKLASFKYVSTHEAEAIYKEKNKDDPLLLELVDYKILPPSIEITATEIEALPQLKEILEKQEGLTDIVYYEDIVSSLSRWINNLRLVGATLIAYLLFQAVLVIGVITTLKLLYRREEIEIMRLLGASAGFIRWPFVLEGIFYGVVSAFLAWLLAYIALLYSTPFLVSWLQDINLLPVPFTTMLYLLAGHLLVGVLVGAFSSVLAVRRFLRV